MCLHMFIHTVGKNKAKERGTLSRLISERYILMQSLLLLMKTTCSTCVSEQSQTTHINTHSLFAHDFSFSLVGVLNMEATLTFQAIRVNNECQVVGE